MIWRAAAAAVHTRHTHRHTFKSHNISLSAFICQPLKRNKNVNTNALQFAVRRNARRANAHASLRRSCSFRLWICLSILLQNNSMHFGVAKIVTEIYSAKWLLCRFCCCFHCGRSFQSVHFTQLSSPSAPLSQTKTCWKKTYGEIAHSLPIVYDVRLFVAHTHTYTHTHEHTTQRPIDEKSVVPKCFPSPRADTLRFVQNVRRKRAACLTWHIVN